MQRFICTLLFIFFTSSSMADMVFMRESDAGKHILLQRNSGETTVLTSGEQWHLYPDISADGAWVCWVEGTETNLEIALQHLPTKKKEMWKVPFSGRLLQPKFSKNGKLLFFSGPSNLAGKSALFFIDLEKTRRQHGPHQSIYQVEPVQIDESESAFFPRPSSDGNYVVYHRSSGAKREVVLFNRIENKKEIIAEGMSPALSFDETLIAFTAKEQGNWSIFFYNRISKKIERMTNGANEEMAPTFRPDNSFVFASNQSGNFKIYEIKNGEWLALTTGDGDDYAPAFSGERNHQQNELAPFIGEARSSFGTIVHAGKLYMVGGHQGKEHTYPPESFSDETLVYEQKTNQWQRLSPRPHKAHGFQLAAYGNYLYAFGGFAYNANNKPKWYSLNAIDRYDIEKNEWTTIGQLPRRRSSNAAITVKDQVYLVGGWDSTPKHPGDIDGTFLSAIDVFDLVTEQVRTAAFEMPKPLRRAFSGVNYNNQLVLVGGLGEGGSHFELISHVTSIDPESGNVFEYPALPFATFAPAAGVLNNELFVFGGMFKLSDMEYDYVAHIYALDFTSKQWRHTGRYVQQTKGFSQVFNLDDKSLGILGGHHYFEGYDAPLTNFETFTPAATKF